MREKICIVHHCDPSFAIVWSKDCHWCGGHHFRVTNSDILNQDSGCPIHHKQLFGWGRVMIVNKFCIDEAMQAMRDPKVLGTLESLHRSLVQSREQGRAAKEQFFAGAKERLSAPTHLKETG